MDTKEAIEIAKDLIISLRNHRKDGDCKGVEYRRFEMREKSIEHLIELSTPRLMEECLECKGDGQKKIEGVWCDCYHCNGTGKKPSVTEEGIIEILNEECSCGEVVAHKRIANKIMKYMEGNEEDRYERGREQG